MRKLVCDRCGVELKIAKTNIWVGSRMTEPIDLCENCTIAFDEFLAYELPTSRKEGENDETAT